jgi:two-component system, NtrC family, nitrogen regulation sensor histidine kinase NtrY
MTKTGHSSRRLYARFLLWSRRVGLSRKLAFALAIAAVVSGFMTWAAMTQTTESDPNETKTVISLLYLDAVLLLLLGAVVARRLTQLWTARSRGHAGSGLHIKLVMMFSIVAVTPAILVTILSALFLSFGLDTWFNDRVRTALGESRAVAKAYLHEHIQTIQTDVLSIAADIDRNAHILARDNKAFEDFLTAQGTVRNLPETLVMNSGRRVIAKSALSLSLTFELASNDAISQADQGKIVVLTNENDDRVRAMIKLNRLIDSYLLVGRRVDPKVLGHIERTEGAVSQYEELEQKRDGISITAVIIFVIIALLMLLAAVWIGLTLATQLVRPIGNLITAAERVRKGDLTVRVENLAAKDEFTTLNRSFNRMTSQLETQQLGLMEANRQLDERRRFTETVLSGVSAGVIGLNSSGEIHLPNRSASDLLGVDLEDAVGQKLSEVVPEMESMLMQAYDGPERPQQGEVKLIRKGQFKTLLVSIASERLGNDIIGYVVTFDDVTELFSAQRQAAWSDVARRIAHEIKNPLTPIQLSAERLKRKYLKEITSDPETFSICTDTIVRQVEEIGRMVSEFSSFARMPEPTMKPENLSNICRQSFSLERNRHPEFKYEIQLPEADVLVPCDAQQLSQVLTNVLKNASESVIARVEGDSGDDEKGYIGLTLSTSTIGTKVETSIQIEDNGIGLPKVDRDRLTEPYVTTRTKGTGLGLAIVKKIMEDHSGELILEDRDPKGAFVSLVIRPSSEIQLTNKINSNLHTEMSAHGT